MNDLISRDAVINALKEYFSDEITRETEYGAYWHHRHVIDVIEHMPSAQPEAEKYEYHYDHTDCIWYRPEARNRCPVTCAQYRDGWNDAMNYIFRDGKGYRPYRRGEQYEE